ncbi:MAG: hypothetical protein HYS04_06360 [Acidobacteria bacterium]|nr:hypothetical protein [Acidobacteriota bacterium]
MAPIFRDVIDILSALTTPVTAGIATLIAYRQYKTDQLRLRHEGYERRVAVFRGVLEHLSAILRHGKATLELLPDYVKATSEKEFLFGADLCAYLDEIYRRTVEAWRLDEENRTIPVGDLRKAAVVNQEAAQFEWLLLQIPEVRTRFAPYLRLE